MDNLLESTGLDREPALAPKLRPAFYPAILDSLAASVAVIDGRGHVVFVNKSWRRIAAENGAGTDAGVGVGANYLEVCARAARREQTAQVALDGIQGVLEGNSSAFIMDSRCRIGDTTHWFRMDVSALGAWPNLGAVISHLDITPHKRAEFARPGREHPHPALFEQAAAGLGEVDGNGAWLRTNARMRQIFGWSTTRPDASLLALTHPDDRDAHRALIQAMTSGDIDVSRAERRLRRDDGVYLPCEVAIKRIRKSDGLGDSFSVAIQDLSGNPRVGERQHDLIRELTHRGKNLLALVDAIAARTLRETGTPAEALATFSGRLRALAATYDTLIDENSGGIPIREFFQSELAAFGARARIEGPTLLVSGKSAQTFRLLSHELVTNAAKHGALSAPGGQIAISWTTTGSGAEGTFAFEWRESAGPAPQQPTRRGFGSELLEDLVGSEFDCDPSLNFALGGLHYRFEARLDRIGVAALDSGGIAD